MSWDSHGKSNTVTGIPNLEKDLNAIWYLKVTDV
jgi:hypothetical protein